MAVTSPFTSYARAYALRSEFVDASLKGAASAALFLSCRKPSLVGAGRGLGKVKEEVTANGRRRGTFAQTPACPDGALQLAETSGEDALR
ncbi:hypothetical protein CEE58_13075 [Stenotrophomonas maltophilia]|nr:hypothetical protein CEE58_13075 [Stenotrophomonas maltophilia]